MAKIKKEFKNKFTTVSNDFLFDQRMATAERGLLITMLGLPDSWDFSGKGLTAILPNGKSSIYASLRKLEELGYLKRTRVYKNGKVIDWEYTFSDSPLFLEYGEKLQMERQIKASEMIVTENQEVENLVTDFQEVENQEQENQEVENLEVENRYNNKCIKESNTKELNTIGNQSIYQSNTMTPIEQMREIEKKIKNKKKIDGRMERKPSHSYEKLIKDNIEYPILLERYPYEKDRINEITNIIIDTMDSPRDTVNIEGYPKPWENVCQIFAQLTFAHIEYVIDSFNRNTTEIRNLKAYILTSLYNSYFTIDNYYSAKVKHDMPWLAKG